MVQGVTSKPYCTDTEVVGSILGEVTRTGIFSHRMPRKLVNKIDLKVDERERDSRTLLAIKIKTSTVEGGWRKTPV